MSAKRYASYSDWAAKTIDETFDPDDCWAAALAEGAARERERLLVDMDKLARKWRRDCGLPGGACVQQEERRYAADEARKQCARDIEALVEALGGEA